MKREYIRGNKEHWKELYELVYGVKPEILDDRGSFLGSDKCIILIRDNGTPLVLDSADEDGKMILDAVTTNPNWHEVKPWKDNWKPKPFYKVLGWDDKESEAVPDIFLFKGSDYICAYSFYKHIKPYDEEEYLKQQDKIDKLLRL